MKKILMPDDLIWQAGLEYGIQALSKVAEQGGGFKCFIKSKGPFLEPVSFAIHQMKMGEKISYVEDTIKYLLESDIVLLPRVCPLDKKIIERSLKNGKTVITSDPSIAAGHPGMMLFMRRDWEELSGMLAGAVRQED